MKITVWVEREEDIPDISKLIDISEEALRLKLDTARSQQYLCLFQVDVNEEQWRRIRHWHGDRMMQLAYITKQEV